MEPNRIKLESASPPPPRRRDTPLQNPKPLPSCAMKKIKIPKNLESPGPSGFDSDSDMKDDLKDLGFSAKRIKEIMAKQEPAIQQYQTPSEEAKTKEAATRSERLQRGGKEKHGAERLSLTAQDTNWVLFDPLRGYPKQAGEPPELFQKLEMCKAGNGKILEYNEVSGSVRVRSAPRCLEGREVVYLGSGSKLVEGGRRKRAGEVGRGGEVEGGEVEDDVGGGRAVE